MIALIYYWYVLQRFGSCSSFVVASTLYRLQHWLQSTSIHSLSVTLASIASRLGLSTGPGMIKMCYKHYKVNQLLYQLQYHQAKLIFWPVSPSAYKISNVALKAYQDSSGYKDSAINLIFGLSTFFFDKRSNTEQFINCQILSFIVV